MPPVYFVASYGNVPLLVLDVSTQRGRDLAVQSPSRGDKHTLNDRGKRQLVANCEIKFCNQPGLADYLDRYDAFIALAEGTSTQIFTHPIDGSYPARIGNIDARHASDELCMLVSCTIYRDDEPDNVAAVGAGAAPTAGVEATATAAALANESLAAAGLESSAPDDVLGAVTAWSEATRLDSQDVFVKVQALTDQIDEVIDELELATNLANWPAYQQMINLRYQLVRAAEAVTATTEVIVDLFVDVAQPLLAICAQVYGGAEAQERADEIAKSNRLRTPGLVPRGTTLKIPRPEST